MLSTLRDLRFELSPPALVLLVASGMISATLLARYLISDTARVRASVPYEYAARASDKSVSFTSPPPEFKFPDGEVIRTANRMKEVLSLAYVINLKLIPLRLRNQPVPQTASQLLFDVTRAGLLHPGLKYDGRTNLISSPLGTIAVRYQPRPEPRFEIVHVGRVPLDGPALMLRFPGEVENQFFQSIGLENIQIPPPFAAVPEVIAAGWTVERLPSYRLVLSPAEREQLTSAPAKAGVRPSPAATVRP